MFMKENEQGLNNQSFPQRRETLDPFYEPTPTTNEEYDLHEAINIVGETTWAHVSEETKLPQDDGLSKKDLIEAAEKIVSNHKPPRLLDFY